MRVAVLVSSLTLGVLSGCTTPSGHNSAARATTSRPDTPTTDSTQSSPAVAGLCDGRASGVVSARLPADFRAVAAFRCTTDEQSVPGRGQWMVTVEQEVTGASLIRLVSALRQPVPDQPPTTGACALALVAPYFLVLEGQHGQLLRPVYSIGPCGQPISPAFGVAQTLPWRTASTELVRQIETQAEATSGCQPAWKDLFDLNAYGLTPAGPGRPIVGHPDSLSVCIYRDDPNNAPDHLQGSTVVGPDDTGTFVAGGSVSGATESAILAGLTSGRASATCPSAHPEFAVISPVGREPTTYVELGGCDRLLKMSYNPAGHEVDGIGQASPLAVSLISHTTP